MTGVFIVRMKPEATDTDRDDVEELLRAAIDTYPIEVGGITKRRRRRKPDESKLAIERADGE